MPFYEYECENCKFYTELLQKVSDPPLKKCPSCGKTAMKKLVSAPVFRLKGGGWYETDFKGDSENKRNLAVDKEPDTSSDSKPAKAAATTDAKADAKPAADAKPSEPASKPAESSSGGERKGASSSRTSAASRSKARPAAGRSVSAKAKPKPVARRPAARKKGR